MAENCKNCGAPLLEGSTYCGQCGANQVEPVQSEQAMPVEMSNEQQVEQAPVTAEATTPVNEATEAVQNEPTYDATQSPPAYGTAPEQPTYGAVPEQPAYGAAQNQPYGQQQPMGYGGQPPHSPQNEGPFALPPVHPEYSSTPGYPPTGGYGYQVPPPIYTPPYAYMEPKKANGIGVASFILGLVSLFFCGFPLFSIPAIICGIIGLNKHDDMKFNNRWMSIAGLILGAAMLLIFIVYILLIVWGSSYSYYW